METNKRLLSIDMARGLAVFLLVPLHCMMMLASVDTWTNTTLGSIMQVVEKGSPMFMLLMGFSFVFSKRQEFKPLAWRGLKIAGIGYLLNTLKFVVPIALMGGLPENLVTAHKLDPSNTCSNMAYFFMLGDILQLAGISLVIMALIQKVFENRHATLITALLVVIVSREISGYRPGIVGLDYIAGLLWGNQYNVFFPIFPWMAFILIGRFLGDLYMHNDRNEGKLYKSTWVYGAAFIIAGLALCAWNYEYHFGDYYHLGPGGTIILIGINILLVNLGYIFVKFIPHNRFFDLVYFGSANVTFFYIMQWVLIDWSMVLFFGFAQQTQGMVLIMMVVVQILTYTIVFLKNKLITRTKKEKTIAILKSKQAA